MRANATASGGRCSHEGAESVLQVPFDRSWATLNVFGRTVLYIVLAPNC